MKLLLQKFLKALSSLKLTIIILSLIIISTIPATMIVQNQTPEFYFANYPATLGSLIVLTSYDHFFSSSLFLFLLGLFWLNLFSCSVKRFIRQIQRKGKKRFGPDILHFGLLIMIIASMVSFSLKEEGFVYMRAGDAMKLPSGRYLNMEEFIFEHYPDGRPKSWISKVNISDSFDKEGEKYSITVNQPLRIDKLVFYQTGYRPARSVGEYETGLMITYDPGKILMLLSFIVISAGLMLTFIQKMKDQRIKL